MPLGPRGMDEMKEEMKETLLPCFKEQNKG